MAMEDKHKHLEFIQNVIDRMAQCSFQIKNWTIIIVAALVALLTRNGEPTLIILAPIFTVVFWGLDGFYLLQERLYRNLYDHVRKQEETDFSMNAMLHKGKTDTTWIKVVISKTLLVFYGTLSLISLFLFIAIQYFKT
ncbi:MAG: hypothetical protein OXC82_08015 [Rhodobacteraceae bacterium]|nr:hypothetical protein [Paracoccaceae bacterium]MCY4250361.1 hypothetical protein [Paracoccaceae bacterium]